MIDLKRETAIVLAGVSEHIAQGVVSWSFEFWQRKDFRLYVEFYKLSQTEQDRIFNELEVSLLGLFILHFEQATQDAARPEQKVVFSGLQKDLTPAFMQIFANLDIDKKHLLMWQRLIELRLKEYREDLKIALKESRKMKEFDGKDEQLRATWARIETVTIDCLTHIRRGEVKEGDPLWKLLRKLFISLDAQLNPITSLKFEG